uniref:phosphate ABC transporter permease family protein n=1 Tax=Marivita sp. TaxID=2003365 RepID=UPI003F6B98FB
MPLLWLFLLVLAIAAGAFVLARARVMALAGQDRRTLHSLPIYYGSNAAMKSAIPALLVLVLWLLAQPFYVNNAVSDMIPESA